MNNDIAIDLENKVITHNGLSLREVYQKMRELRATDAEFRKYAPPITTVDEVVEIAGTYTLVKHHIVVEKGWTVKERNMSEICHQHKPEAHGRYPKSRCPYCRIAELEQQLAVLTSVKTKGESTLFNEICAANRKLNHIKVLAELCNQLEELQEHNKDLEQRYNQNHQELLQIHRMVMNPRDHWLDPAGYTAKQVKIIIDRRNKLELELAQTHILIHQDIKLARADQEQITHLEDQNAKLIEALREVANIIEPDQPHDELLIDAVRIAAAALKEVSDDRV
jgi:hypothetical protein